MVLYLIKISIPIKINTNVWKVWIVDNWKVKYIEIDNLKVKCLNNKSLNSVLIKPFFKKKHGLPEQQKRNQQHMMDTH